MIKEATSVPSEQVEEPIEFVMPRPEKGQALLFYPSGRRSAATAIIGYCTKVSNRNLEMVVHGLHREGVRFIDDPLLDANPHARDFGAWEFTQRDVLLNKLLEANLLERIEQLEATENKKLK